MVESDSLEHVTSVFFPSRKLLRELLKIIVVHVLLVKDLRCYASRNLNWC